MNQSSQKSRIAIFGMGTLDAGNLGVPVMIDLFGRLSSDFDIVFYSFLPIDTSLVPESIIVRQPVSWHMPWRVKYLLVGLRCAWDHLLNPFSLLFAVSVYPSALCATFLGKLFRRPSIVQLIATEGGTSSGADFGNLTVPWLEKITRSVCKRADFVVTVADYQKAIAEKNLDTRKEMIILPLRINTKMFPYRERSLSFPVQFIQIAFYSALKDQDTMFAAFAKIAQKIACNLTVIGEGFNVPKVQQMMIDLKISDKVTFTGYIKNQELQIYLNNAHILLHTARFETGCAVIQEAMASGVAVCGTKVGILFDIGEQYAVIVPPGDVDQLAEKILQLVRDPQAYHRIKSNAYAWITQFDAEWSYKNYLSFFEAILSGTRKD